MVGVLTCDVELGVITVRCGGMMQHLCGMFCSAVRNLLANIYDLKLMRRGVHGMWRYVVRQSCEMWQMWWRFEI